MRPCFELPGIPLWQRETTGVGVRGLQPVWIACWVSHVLHPTHIWIPASAGMTREVQDPSRRESEVSAGA